jgi:hypothetical protein
MAKPIIGMVPPTGWHYHQSDNRIGAHDYPSLVKAVENYRAENHLPSGDPEGDINSYICSNWPTFCHGVDMVTVTAVQSATPATDLMNDIQTWAKNLMDSKKVINFVSDDVAEQRTRTCLDCKHNVNWRGGCSSCVVSTERLCASVRQARDTKMSPVLGGCAMMRHDNRTAIFLEKEMLAKCSDLPHNCWLNN